MLIDDSITLARLIVIQFSMTIIYVCRPKINMRNSRDSKCPKTIRALIFSWYSQRSKASRATGSSITLRLLEMLRFRKLSEFSGVAKASGDG